MHTVVMKYFRYDMRRIVDRWNLNVSFSRREEEMVKRMSEDVSNLPTFSSWGGCSELPPKCIWITGKA